MISIVLVLLILVMCITVLSCVSDVTTLKIPNWHSLAIVGLFVLAYFFGSASFAPLWQHITAAVAMFIISYVMFTLNIMGGGDSKLATALSLWLGLKGLLPFVILLSLAGGAVGAATLFLRKKKPFKNPREGSWIAVAQSGGNAVPYAVAIVFGFWVSIFHTLFPLTLS